MQLSKNIELFDKKKHDRKKFDCGNPDLNIYLKKYLAQNIKKNLIKAYVTTEKDTGRILGYYTISSASIAHESIDSETTRQLPKYPMPAILIGRLASDIEAQNKKLGIGKKLLIHALKNSLNISKKLGVLFVIVDAKDGAESFYLHYGFSPLTKNSDQLFIKISDIEKIYK